MNLLHQNDHYYNNPPKNLLRSTLSVTRTLKDDYNFDTIENIFNQGTTTRRTSSPSIAPTVVDMITTTTDTSSSIAASDATSSFVWSPIRISGLAILIITITVYTVLHYLAASRVIVAKDRRPRKQEVKSSEIVETEITSQQQQQSTANQNRNISHRVNQRNSSNNSESRDFIVTSASNNVQVQQPRSSAVSDIECVSVDGSSIEEEEDESIDTSSDTTTMLVDISTSVVVYAQEPKQQYSSDSVHELGSRNSSSRTSCNKSVPDTISTKRTRSKKQRGEQQLRNIPTTSISPPDSIVGNNKSEAGYDSNFLLLRPHDEEMIDNGTTRSNQYTNVSSNTTNSSAIDVDECVFYEEQLQYSHHSQRQLLILPPDVYQDHHHSINTTTTTTITPTTPTAGAALTTINDTTAMSAVPGFWVSSEDALLDITY